MNANERLATRHNQVTSSQQSDTRKRAGLLQRVTHIAPFAHRQDCDDVAAFTLVDGVPTEQVVVVHLTWRGRAEAPGWPSIFVYAHVREWLEGAVLREAKRWCAESTEDQLAEMYAENQV
jgi:hypothetical protein